MEKQKHSLPVFLLLATALVISWTSGFLGIRLATETASVPLVLFWRNLVAGLLLLPFALLIGPRITWAGLKQQMVFGFIAMFLYLASFAVAIGQRVPTGLVALISDLVPLAVAVLSQPLLQQKLSRAQWFGTFLGVIGVLVVSADSLQLGSAPLAAYILPVLGMVLFAGMTVMQKKMGAIDMALHQSIAIHCLTACVCFAIWQLSVGSLAPPREPSFIVGIIWLVLIATYVAYSVYYYLLRHYSPSRVSAVVFLSPPVTMIWAYFMFDEPLTLMIGFGLLITLVGVYFAAIKK